MKEQKKLHSSFEAPAVHRLLPDSPIHIVTHRKSYEVASEYDYVVQGLQLWVAVNDVDHQP